MHICIDHTSVVGIGKDGLQEACPGKHLPRTSRKMLQKLAFPLGQDHPADVVECYCPGANVERPAWNPHQVRGVGVAPQQGPQPRQQFIDIKRLAHIILCTPVQTLDPVRRIAQRRENERRGGDPFAAQALQNIQTFNCRQAPIHRDHIKMPAESLMEGPLPVSRHQHLIAFAAKQIRQHRCQCGIILHHQYTRFTSHDVKYRWPTCPAAQTVLRKLHHSRPRPDEVTGVCTADPTFEEKRAGRSALAEWTGASKS